MTAAKTDQASDDPSDPASGDGDRAARIADRPVRVDRFTTEGHKPRHQFAWWYALMSPILEVSPVSTPEADFHASGRAYDLGCLHLVSLRMNSLSFRHTQEHIEGTGIDPWCLTVMKTGALACDANMGGSEITAGSLGVLSFAEPFTGRASATDTLNLFLNRDDFHDFAAGLDAIAQRPVSGPMTSLLREFLLNAEVYLPSMKASEVSMFLESLTLLLRAAVSPSGEAIAAADLPVSAGRFNLVRRHIQDHLASPDLGAASICKALNLSRRQLYYLFEPHGGVAGFIKQRRLTAACRALANSNDHRLISTIAYTYGYTNQALFSRHFQAEFGFGPREARAAKLCGYLPQASAPKSFAEWLGRGSR
ncbi:helix-turn-helix domain-containing protein [uncultured Roseibium sp.]|uniref:helix-turn-helix domain-containing protein n=1 Tax=uncultured Roseibium sp. TaxID=1936171 RepID=UPI0032167106